MHAVVLRICMESDRSREEAAYVGLSVMGTE